MPGLRKAAGVAIFIAALGVFLRPTAAGVRLEEDLARRWLFGVRGAVAPPPGVAVVSIDKTSSDQLGLSKEDWPPPRRIHAAVIRSLTRHGVSAIILDVFFRNQRDPADDADLAAAMAESGKVALFERVERLKYAGGEIVQLRSPIEQFQTAALATGAFPLPDRSPVTFFWSFLDATGEKLPTLPAVALQMHALPHLNRLLSLLRDEGITNVADMPDRVATRADFRQMMTVLSRELRTHADGAKRALRRLERDGGNGMTAAERNVLAAVIRLYVGAGTHDLNFYGPAGRIRTVPFHELLTDTVNSRVDLTGMVVFVGEGATELVSSADQRDTYPTVYSEDGVDLSGAEIAATAFANLLTNRTLRRVQFSAEVAILLAFALVAALFARVLPVRLAAGAVLGLACAHYGIAQYLFSVHAVLIPVGIPLVIQAPLSLFAAVWMRYRNVRRQVPREVDPDMRPQQVPAVCLSIDIENYVGASEKLEPRDLARLMSEYYATLSALVARREGVMMGRGGDSAMCVWADTRKPWPVIGWFRTPSAQNGFDVRARANACRAALDIRDAVLRFNERHATPLRTRVGLHAGPVALGPVGGEYHVVGEVPNTASRIEGLNKTLRTTILASDVVVRQQEDFYVRPLGRFLLAGRSRPIDVVEIVGQRETIGESTLELGRRFGGALEVFQTGDLAKAASLFQAIADEYPSDGPSRYYYHLCQEQPASAAPLTRPPAIQIDVK